MMRLPFDVKDLCQAYLDARETIEGDVSGDMTASGRALRTLRLHLEATFECGPLEPTEMENMESDPDGFRDYWYGQ